MVLHPTKLAEEPNGLWWVTLRLRPAYAETGAVARLRVALRALATPRLGFLPFGLLDQMAYAWRQPILACLGVEKTAYQVT